MEMPKTAGRHRRGRISLAKFNKSSFGGPEDRPADLIGAVAQDLGIADQSLRNWVKQSDLDAGRRADGLTTEERAEVRRLGRENRVLKEEQAILVT